METSVNNKCKAFTSLEQSRKLAEILPLESADMRIGNCVGKSGKVDGTNVHYYPKGESFGAPEIINAWSLAALLGVLPYPYIEQNYKGKWTCRVEHGNTTYLWEDSNPIDACVAMIEKLHEQNIL